MELTILFMGPVGSGKTNAISVLSDIEVIDTDVAASDETALLKDKTTVAMDVGVLELGGGDKLRLYGAPGQDRFDFMWDILLTQAKCLVITLNHANPDPLGDLAHYAERISANLGSRKLPVAIAITHMDQYNGMPISRYREALQASPMPFALGTPPVFSVDARKRHDVRALVLTLAAQLEMGERFCKTKTTRHCA